MISNKQLPIAVTMGDPAGVGGECMIAAWQGRDKNGVLPFFAVDNVQRLRKISTDTRFVEIASPDEALKAWEEGALPVFNINLPEMPVMGQLNTKNGTAVMESIERAVQFALTNQASAVVTNPIHKAALYDIGFEFAGHTEYLAQLCSTHHEKNFTSVMMLATEELRVVPLTVHIAVKDIAREISIDMIKDKATIIHDDLKLKFGLKDPHIAIAGLNPHAGEGGKMGQEEINIIQPAIEQLRAQGMRVSGAHPADTLFHAEARAGYDVALCMYHDQALIPLKTLDFHGGVNVTLGLPIIRTSPDHGTALDIAGKNIANPSSLIAALKMAQQMSNRKING